MCGVPGEVGTEGVGFQGAAACPCTARTVRVASSDSRMCTWSAQGSCAGLAETGTAPITVCVPRLHWACRLGGALVKRHTAATTQDKNPKKIGQWLSG